MEARAEPSRSRNESSRERRVSGGEGMVSLKEEIRGKNTVIRGRKRETGTIGALSQSSNYRVYFSYAGSFFIALLLAYLLRVVLGRVLFRGVWVGSGVVDA